MKLVVALIDPQPLRREPLAQALQQEARGLRVVGLHTVSDLAAWPWSSMPSLALLHHAQAGLTGDGIGGEIAAIHSTVPGLPVVVLSDSEVAQDILAVVGHGARGYLPMTLEAGAVVKVLRLVAAGGSFVPVGSLMAHLGASPHTAGSLERNPGADPSPRTAKSSPSRTLTGLDPQQEAVVDLLQRGQSNRAIAHALNLPETAVKHQVRQIMKRLGVNNRTRAALALAQIFLNM